MTEQNHKGRRLAHRCFRDKHAAELVGHTDWPNFAGGRNHAHRNPRQHHRCVGRIHDSDYNRVCGRRECVCRAASKVNQQYCSNEHGVPLAHGTILTEPADISCCNSCWACCFVSAFGWADTRRPSVSARPVALVGRSSAAGFPPLRIVFVWTNSCATVVTPEVSGPHRLTRAVSIFTSAAFTTAFPLSTAIF